MEIEAKRLIIRPFTPDDLPEFKKLLTIRELPGWVMQQERAEDFLKWHISWTKAIRSDITVVIRSIELFFIKSAKS